MTLEALPEAEVRAKIEALNAEWRAEHARHRAVPYGTAEHKRHFAALEANFDARQVVWAQCEHRWVNAPGDPGYHSCGKTFCGVCNATKD